MAKPHVVILGAGPAGVGAAFQLTRKGLAQVTLLEECKKVGGIASSFELSGLRVDYGSHRLHPSCDLEILKDIRTLLGDDLLNRPRHGRIRLKGRWIHFPLKPMDLILQLPISFTTGVAKDLMTKLLGSKTDQHKEESFASVLERGLGQTICRDFYFPYTHKIWGLPPEELSATQARRRVNAGSTAKLVGKILSALPVFNSNRRGHFFYPRYGFGQIPEAYYKAANQAGAEIHLNSRVKSVEITKGGINKVYYEKDGQALSISADYVWSTIPITTLAKSLRPYIPADVLQAADKISYRAMILIYLVLEQDRFSMYDAHYFPDSDIPISRLSEPKHYSDVQGPQNLTILCAEFPCSPDEADWGKTDEELGKLVGQSLEKAGIPIKTPIIRVVTRRLHQAYPLYRRGYEVDFQKLDDWLSQIDGLLIFGRQGLFVHDNIHHALYMAYSAVKCLKENGSFDSFQWQSYKQIFNTFVVED
jgi:protoporphyrinogen oxidase